MPIERVALIGGTGFVGRHLAHRLAESGIACTVLTRHPHRHRQLLTTPGLTLHQANPYDPGALAKPLRGCDAVVNLVGILNADRHTSFERAHVALVQSVLDAAARAGVPRLLHMSALNAAGDAPSEYLRSKARGEDLAHERGKAAGIAVTSFRPSVIFGSDDSFINRFASLVKLPGPMPLACADARFAPVYVGDVAAAFEHALHDPATAGHRYDLCGPEEWTLGQIVGYVATHVQRPKRIIALPDWAARLQAALLQFAPGKPFTPDNYRSLQIPSVCACNQLPELGVTPTPMDAVVPGFLAPRALKGPRGLH